MSDLESLLKYNEIVKKMFANEEEGFQFYNDYGFEKEFSVRRSYCEWDNGHNEMTLRKFICSRQGFCEEKQLKRAIKKWKPRNITRVGCLAKFVIARDHITGRISDEKKAEIVEMESSGIRKHEIMDIPANICGGRQGYPVQQTCAPMGRGIMRMTDHIERKKKERHHLLDEVHVLYGEQSSTEALYGSIVHDCGARGGEHINEVGKCPRSEQHDVGAGTSGGRLILVAEHPDEDWDEGVDEEGGERVLGADGERLAELHEGLELARLVAVRLQAGEDPLEVTGRGGGGR
ncbi:unnamed protein product [Miscanthus lutarioriparius]|uniref:FAR1 domain-containing protein n=1 Tax=Miscanthus lutarioriparius TaxID=422564 RepID=A0A811N6S1_9POAL|nr:unnamed protein product [Miscanthus lutarioriparius]